MHVIPVLRVAYYVSGYTKRLIEMKVFRLLICIIALLGLNSCTYSSETKLESEIINDIFLQITDIDEWYPIFPPPPPPQLIDKNGNNIDSLNTEKYKEFISKINTTRHVLSLEDSTYVFLDTAKIIENLKAEGLYILLKKGVTNFIQDNKKGIPIRINEIKNTGQYELIKRSEILPRGFNFRKNPNINWTYWYFGNLMFSKPLIDENKKYGLIVFAKKCGYECDVEYILIIRKTKDKWIIDRKILI
jgi:hypothetical protein